MNVKRFSARTSRDALNLVRQAFGADAVVLSTRPCAEGVEVMAMAPDSVPQIERFASEPAMPPAGTAAETSVEQDVAQLSMSTLSFQDYVRERMLRRRRAEQQAEAQQQADAAQAEARAAELQARPVPQAASLLRVRDERTGLQAIEEDAEAKAGPMHEGARKRVDVFTHVGTIGESLGALRGFPFEERHVARVLRRRCKPRRHCVGVRPGRAAAQQGEPHRSARRARRQRGRRRPD